MKNHISGQNGTKQKEGKNILFLNNRTSFYGKRQMSRDKEKGNNNSNSKEMLARPHNYSSLHT